MGDTPRCFNRQAFAMKTYQNIMELLVEKEVERQIQALPQQTADWIEPIHVVTYALNRLPTLYANSEEGLGYQLRKGEQGYGARIAQAVHWAILAVQRDPLQHRTPIGTPQEADERQAVLDRMKVLLKADAIDWHILPDAVEQALHQAAEKAVDSPPAPSMEQSPKAHSGVGAPPPYKRLRKTREELKHIKRKKFDLSKKAGMRKRDRERWDNPFPDWHPS